MKKAIVILILILPLSACLWWDMDVSYDTASPEDKQLYDSATRERSVEKCDTIESYDLRAKCVNYVARRTGDVSACEYPDEIDNSRD